MGDYIEDQLNELVGQTCRIETRDGLIRNEHVAQIEYLKLEIGGKEARIPVSLQFDNRGLDSAELRMIAKLSLVK